MSLKKDILKVSSSNILILVSSIVNGFILPAVLSISDFANLRTYTLYVGFVGFMHLGFVDGINIKYGGKTSNQVDQVQLGIFHRFFLIFQSAVTLIVLLLGLILKNNILLFTGLSILPINTVQFFLYYYQAIGNFSKYSLLAIISPISNIVIVVLMVVIKVKTFEYYIIAQIFGYALALIIVEINFRKENAYKRQGIKFWQFTKPLKAVFYSGFFIMLGNILFIVFFDLGRWISKIFMDEKDFAIYTFGVSLIGFLAFFINAVTQSFYPHLSRNFSPELVARYRKTFFVLGSYGVLGYFVIQFLITRYIEKYTDSIILTGIMLTSVPGILIIKSLYLNLYKVFKKEKQFLLDTAKILGVSIIINGILFTIFKNTMSIAIAAVVSVYVWIIFQPSFIQIEKKVRLMDTIYICLFVSCTIVLLIAQVNILFKAIISFLFISILNFTIYSKTTFEIIKKTRHLMTSFITANYLYKK